MCRAGLSEADGIVITNRNINKGHLKFAIYPNRKFDGPSIMRLVQSADELSQKIKEHRSSNNNNQVSQEDIMTAMCREGHNFVTIDDCWIDSHIPGTRRIFRADLAPPPGPMPVEDVEFLAQLLARTNLSE